MIFFDLEKAFDNIDHSIMIQILEESNIKRNTLNIIKLLFNSFHFTIQGNETGVNTIGVPQGSSTSPIFFIIYINEVINRINQLNRKEGMIKLYVDDICVRAYSE